MIPWQTITMDNIQYFKIRINTIVPGKPTTFDVFIGINGNYTLYLRAGDPIDREKIEQLVKKDMHGVFFVREFDRPAYKKYVHTQMTSTDLDVATKAKILRESSITLMEELYEHPDVNQALDHSRPIITDFIDFMKAEPDAMANLISLSSHDFYTYNHSLDVSVYSLGLAEALGFNKADLEEMGVGALFHDIGKRNVSLDILCKKGPLDDLEWQQMQKHPQFGLVILNNHPTISDAIKAACFEHHESFSGNGYPQQLVGQEIHPMARIVAITDTYDAMTTQRSYNTPLAPVDAVTMMRDKLTGRYDPEMLKAMHSVLFKIKAA